MVFNNVSDNKTTIRLKLVISKNSPPKFPDHAVTMAQTRADPSLRLREQDKKSRSEGVP